MSASRQFNRPILNTSPLSSTHTSNTIANIFTNNSNVGIGTTSPSTRLDIIGPNFTYLNTRTSSVSEIRGARTSNTPETILRLGTGHYFGVNWASSAEFQLYNYSSVNQAANSGLNIRLGAGATDNPDTSIMTLLASGNVGIGTTTPSFTLDINGTFETSNSNGLMLFSSNGNLGINTTSPSQRLHVNGNYSNYQNSTTGYLELSQGWVANAGYVSFHQADGTRKGYIGYGGTTDAFLLQGEGDRKITIATNNIDRIIITSDGNVGISRVSPSFKLDIAGTLRATGPGGVGTNGSVLITGGDSFGHSLYIASSSGTQKRIGFNHNGTVGNIWSYDYGASTPQNLMLQFAGGNVGIGSNSAECRLVVNRGSTVTDVIPTTGLGGSTCFNFLHSGGSDYGLIGGILSSTGLVWLQSKYNATTGTLPMALQPLGGNVGINTASPDTLLTIDTPTQYDGNVIKVRAKQEATAYNASFTAKTTSGLVTWGFNIRNGNTDYNDVLVFARGNVGIGTSNPQGKLHIVDQPNGLISQNCNSNNANATSTLNTINVNQTILGPNCWVGGGINYLYFYGRLNGTNYLWSLTTTATVFTGQHMSYSDTIQISDIANLVGLIVIANGSYKTLVDGNEAVGKDGITINDALPIIELSASKKQKTVFGVITNLSNDKEYRRDDGSIVFDNEDYEFETGMHGRIRVNSLGEGAIWICNEDGNIENGDYIMTSSIPGYGCKQDDDILHNYTVAKITCNVNFTDSDLESKFQVRYLLANGTIITKQEYDNNENAYIAAFVGCTYHCG